jgi:3-methylcrotonyl-CoA carboxylase alpha subunit
VTELVTGLDLVRLQVEVARGRSLTELIGALPIADDSGVDPAVPLRGHAIEVRLYAEDPQNDFMPSTGKLLRYRLPHQPGVRLDTGFAEGDEVSVYYDPMLAKLIAYGDTRAHATRRLLGALARWEVHGVTTNLELLSAIGAHPAFMRGDTHTGFIAEHWPGGFTAEPAPELAWLALAVEALVPSANASSQSGVGGPAKADPVATWRRIGGRYGGLS